MHQLFILKVKEFDINLIEINRYIFHMERFLSETHDEHFKHILM